MDTGWQLVSAAFAGVAGGAVGAGAALWGDRNARRTDRERQHRDERRAAYLEFLDAQAPWQRRARLMHIEPSAGTDDQQVKSLVEDLELALAKLRLAAPEPVAVVAVSLVAAVHHVVGLLGGDRSALVEAAKTASGEHAALLEAMNADLR